MQPEENIAQWAGLWDETASDAVRILDESSMAAKWNKRSDKFGKSPDQERMQKRIRKTVDFLEETGVKIKGAKILDIGSGHGSLSLPLARMGAEVTALDISSGMLDRLNDASGKEGLSVKTVECSWWTADIDKLGFRGEYDLVLAARTPAIRNAECLERMMACSKNLCCYIGFIKKGEYSAHADIRRLILKEEYIRYTNNIFFPFMYLYLSGYRPLISINYSERKVEMKWEKAAEEAIEFLSNDHDFDDEIKDKIRNYYRDLSKDGLYASQSDTSEGMMAWKVGIA
ncbi:MAG: Mg-protoporphyrin IX methyl transferase [Syntrophorhabdus sp. PtaU1.Bin050]|nr:MAG: Mg-protoporphyrin IX methyl transferase [Syntrophorhabdus sp. PtaU1.Bin050]